MSHKNLQNNLLNVKNFSAYKQTKYVFYVITIKTPDSPHFYTF